MKFYYYVPMYIKPYVCIFGNKIYARFIAKLSKRGKINNIDYIAKYLKARRKKILDEKLNYPRPCFFIDNI